MTALFRETDLELAKAAFPPNIELLEGMLVSDPTNIDLHEYAAQAYYGYAFSFVEDENPARAASFYRRGMQHGLSALRLSGFSSNALQDQLDQFNQSVQALGTKSVPALFWAASNWAKWIDMNRDQVDAIGQLPKPVSMMERALELDENYFFAGPHVFMGVYYGSRSPLLGGNFEQSQLHFDKARTLTNHQILLIDVIQAQYLEVQRNDQQHYHQLLSRVLDAPDDLNPDQSLSNAIAKQKAKRLLEQEDQWF